MKVLRLLMWLTLPVIGYELTWIGKSSLTYVLLYILVVQVCIMYYLTSDKL